MSPNQFDGKEEKHPLIISQFRQRCGGPHEAETEVVARLGSCLEGLGDPLPGSFRSLAESRPLWRRTERPGSLRAPGWRVLSLTEVMGILCPVGICSLIRNSRDREAAHDEHEDVTYAHIPRSVGL